jgi:hypothetical protein
VRRRGSGRVRAGGAGHRPVPCPREFVAAVRQQPEHSGVIIGCHAGEVGALGGDQGDTAGVDVVGLAPVTSLKPSADVPVDNVGWL